MDWLTDPQVWMALATLTALEIVLGIDNLLFISILASKLPQEQQSKARKLGLSLAVLSRIALLMSLAWIVKLTNPLFTVAGMEISGRDIIMIGGGLFLIGKATYEIHERLEGAEGHASAKIQPKLSAVLIQIMILDVVFALDSVITAVGMANQLWVMVTAVLLSVGIMLLAADSIAGFADRHPTVKMLALSFLILIGVALLGEGFDQHIPKGYIYFAMAFSVGVEMLNIKARKKTEPVQLHKPYAEEAKA